MLQALAPAMQGWIDVWQGGAGFARVRAAWLERAGPVGEAATVDTGTERIAGTFLDLDGDGALLLRDAHGLQRKVTYGDVTLAEPAREETRLMARNSRAGAMRAPTNSCSWRSAASARSA